MATAIGDQDSHPGAWDGCRCVCRWLSMALRIVCTSPQPSDQETTGHGFSTKDTLLVSSERLIANKQISKISKNNNWKAFPCPEHKSLSKIWKHKVKGEFFGLRLICLFIGDLQKCRCVWILLFWPRFVQDILLINTLLSFFFFWQFLMIYFTYLEEREKEGERERREERIFKMLINSPNSHTSLGWGQINHKSFSQIGAGVPELGPSHAAFWVYHQGAGSEMEHLGFELLPMCKAALQATV